MDEIKLGTLCRDRLSGYVGVACQRVDYIGGMTQFALQPRGTDFKDGKYPDAYNIDEPQIEAVDLKKVKLPGYEGWTPLEITEPEDFGIRLGSQVEDVVSGFKGHTVSKTTFINGCVYFTVEAKANKEKPQEIVQRFLPAKRLKYLNDGVIDKVSTAKTYGPTSRATMTR